jgi:hypothetical protein
VRIAQLVLEGASAYERKCQRVDLATIREAGTVEIVEPGDPRVELVHVYGPDPLPPRELRTFRKYVSSSKPAPSRLPWLRAAEPALITSPASLPEAVEDHYFSDMDEARNVVHFRARDHLAMGSYTGNRKEIVSMAERTLARIRRFRDDVEWKLFETPPTPGEIASLDLWVDPSIDDRDLDGFTAEATVCGTLVVASRTPQNQVRLAGGAAGFLVPVNDPNELAHAIAGALFKEELSAGRRERARELADRFRRRHRASALLALYQKVLR